MKSILLSLVMLLTATSNVENETFPTEFYGVWQSIDNEFVSISNDGSFIRVDGKEVRAQGYLRQEDGKLYIKRTDIDEEYVLSYSKRNDVLVITKPFSTQAWLFFRIGY